MPGVESATNFMVVFNIFIGGYLLYYAIIGKGRLYEGGEYPKAMMEEHVKLLRKFCWYVSIPLLVMSIMEYIEGFGSIWSTLSVLYVLGAIVVYVIIFRKRFGKYLHPEKHTAVQKTSSRKKKKR